MWIKTAAAWNQDAKQSIACHSLFAGCVLQKFVHGFVPSYLDGLRFAHALQDLPLNSQGNTKSYSIVVPCFSLVSHAASSSCYSRVVTCQSCRSRPSDDLIALAISSSLSLCHQLWCYIFQTWLSGPRIYSALFVPKDLEQCTSWQPGWWFYYPLIMFLID